MHFVAVALVKRGPKWKKVEFCYYKNCLILKENWRQPQKCNQAYFKPFSGPFEPEQPLQNEQKSQYPEYLSFAFHD